MNSLKIKNFGPIKEGYNQNDGYMSFGKFSVFCGTQGTGKSTVVKLYSTFAWLEKALFRGDMKKEYVEQYNRFKNKYLAYQGISSYLKKESFIHYKGLAFDFVYDKEKLTVYQHHSSSQDYIRPQIMYYPAERNLLSAIENASGVKGMPDSLSTMLEDYSIACRSLSQDILLPINDVSFSYDKLNKVGNVIGKGYKVRMNEASSGLQSLTPLFITMNYLSESVKNDPEVYDVKTSRNELNVIDKRIVEILMDDSLNDKTRTLLIKKLSDNKNARLISIVEEPEQNLFPTSQESILYTMIRLSSGENDQLMMTTHSPYVLNYLMLSIKAKQVEKSITNIEDKKELELIVPLAARIDGSDVKVYQLSLDGSISLLPTYEEMPSDENILNQLMMDVNRKYSNMIEIQSRYE